MPAHTRAAAAPGTPGQGSQIEPTISPEEATFWHNRCSKAKGAIACLKCIVSAVDKDHIPTCGPNASVPGGNPQSCSFEEVAYIKTNPDRAYGKAQSRGGDANTVLEVVSGVLLYGVSVSLEQCVFMQEGK